MASLGMSRAGKMTMEHWRAVATVLGLGRIPRRVSRESPVTISIHRRVVLILGLAAAVHGRADSALLRPSADTTLLELSPDSNAGGGLWVTAGTTGSQAGNTRNRGLFRFDLSLSIPAGATITNASLTLRVVREPGNEGTNRLANSTFAIHRMLRDWGEGTAPGNRGGLAFPGEATWNDRFATNFSWASPGGAAGTDYSATMSGSKPVTGLGNYIFGSGSNLVADVQDWLDHADSNFGWMLMSLSESTPKTARGFGAREDPANAAILRVDYTSPPWRLVGLTIRTNRFSFSFYTQAGNTYTVRYRTNLAGGDWAVLTNLQATAASRVDIGDPLKDGSRFYEVSTP